MRNLDALVLLSLPSLNSVCPFPVLQPLHASLPEEGDG